MDKFIFVNNHNNDPEIVVVDAKNNKFIKIIVNKNVVVKTTRGYGEYPIGNLWKLGEKNGVGGRLITEAIIKNFSLPLHLWKDNNNTNLNSLQKTWLFLFKNKLSKDADYYITDPGVSKVMQAYFVDKNKENDNFKKAILTDYSTNSFVVNNLSEILQIYNLKTVVSNKSYDKDIDCQVGGKDEYLVNKISNLFSCQISDSNEDLDLVIKIGGAFAQRF